eukprot:TRINITY_DN4185_c0_g1_i1.p1 TRINITY_DN4185_c0_g1~~TRINITY_DN4185_c0_g1_i1.p1  ORF type:complete len:316 (-),score=72.42 TRINITY_DN4185_c0_g1_i1:9-956(-)
MGGATTAGSVPSTGEPLTTAQVVLFPDATPSRKRKASSVLPTSDLSIADSAPVAVPACGVFSLRKRHKASVPEEEEEEVVMVDISSMEGEETKDEEKRPTRGQATTVTTEPIVITPTATTTTTIARTVKDKPKSKKERERLKNRKDVLYCLFALREHCEAAEHKDSTHIEHILSQHQTLLVTGDQSLTEGSCGEIDQEEIANRIETVTSKWSAEHRELILRCLRQSAAKALSQLWAQVCAPDYAVTRQMQGRTAANAQTFQILADRISLSVPPFLYTKPNWLHQSLPLAPSPHISPAPSAISFSSSSSLPQKKGM